MDKDEFWDALTKPTDYKKSCRWCKHYGGKVKIQGVKQNFHPYDRPATNNVASNGHCTYPDIHPGFGCIMKGHKYFEYDDTRT